MLAKHRTRPGVEQKYSLYEKSVQNVEADVEFIRKTFKQHRQGRTPFVLREDFCGTGALMCSSAEQGPRFISHGCDLDLEPMSYGKKFHLTQLNSTQQNRVFYHKQNVLNAQRIKADVITAFNFSYYFFKDRTILKKYFQSVRQSLRPGGMFFMDLFGGTDCYKELEEKTKHPQHTYFWHCQRFDPVTHECHYAIHFQYKGVKYHDVFTYDWRHWSLPELIDLLREVGFKNPTCYWEGEEDDGSGNGIFLPARNEKNCPSWIAYLVSEGR